jgi:hypothetical protein
MINTLLLTLVIQSLAARLRGPSGAPAEKDASHDQVYLPGVTPGSY